MLLYVLFYMDVKRSLILRVDCRVMMFENMVLRKIFEPKKEEITGGK